MRDDIESAVQYALTEGGWRAEDIVGILRGTCRYANGMPIPVCSRCRKPEYEDGLLPSELLGEVSDGEDWKGEMPIQILGGFLCPQCKMKGGFHDRP